MGLPSPYRYVSLGFSKLVCGGKSPHIQGGLGHEEPCGGQSSTLSSQPINDQLGPALVSAEEDLQGAKVSAKTKVSAKAVPRKGRPQSRGSASPSCDFTVPCAPPGLQRPTCKREAMPRARLH